MSNDDLYSERFEQLLRWLFDKPLRIKPALGAPPDFARDDAFGIAATVEQRKAISAVSDGSRAASSASENYVKKLVQEVMSDTLDTAFDPFDQAVVDSINRFHRPILAFADYCNTCASTLSGDELVEKFKSHLEDVVGLVFRPSNLTSYREWDWDNWRFLAQEMFLYVVASFLTHRRFVELQDLLSSELYYDRARDFGYRAKMVPMSEFRSHLKSLDYRSRRLAGEGNPRRTSIHADMLKERSTGSSIDFDSLMQADFVLFLRGFFSISDYWWPESLLYSSHLGPFEIFARARSSKYFDKVRGIFAVQDADDFRAKLRSTIQANDNRIPRYGWHSVEVWELTGAAEIGTVP